jgi:hypothetical protein
LGATMDTFPDYATCERCYATLCIGSGPIDPSTVTRCIDREPTSVTIKGERHSVSSQRTNVLNLWCLSSEHAVKSRDLRDHLNWLFDQLEHRSGHLETLRQMGCRFDVWCYWLSKEGHGGPTLSVPQIEKLAHFRFELLFDIYFLGEPTQESPLGTSADSGLSPDGQT